MSTKRFERFKKMAKDEFGLTVVESDRKTIEQVKELWDKWNSTEVECVDLYNIDVSKLNIGSQESFTFDNEEVK